MRFYRQQDYSRKPDEIDHCSVFFQKMYNNAFFCIFFPYIYYNNFNYFFSPSSVVSVIKTHVVLVIAGSNPTRSPFRQTLDFRKILDLDKFQIQTNFRQKNRVSSYRQFISPRPSRTQIFHEPQRVLMSGEVHLHRKMVGSLNV